MNYLVDNASVYRRWLDLVSRYGTMGTKSYDARLVATMLENSVTHILTYNLADFVRYAAEGIVAVEPDAV